MGVQDGFLNEDFIVLDDYLRMVTRILHIKKAMANKALCRNGWKNRIAQGRLYMKRVGPGCIFLVLPLVVRYGNGYRFLQLSGEGVHPLRRADSAGMAVPGISGKEFSRRSDDG